MLNILSLLPVPILLFIFIVVGITLVTIRLRKVLYDSIEKDARQAKLLLTKINADTYSKNLFIREVRKRYKEASKKLEKVNTIALIERAYQDEAIEFLGKKLKIEQWNYFCKILPNLFIAFGLLGTFLGITQNLASISSILNTSQSTDMIAIENLREPLRSMGVAFSSSLVALLCSSIITVINFFWNTSLAKIELLNALEDYLDNVYQPEIDGHTRLDKAVDRMVRIQNSFLTNFHKSVTHILGRTLGNVANKIESENIKAVQNMNQLVSKFQDGTGHFVNASNSLDSSVKKLEEAIKQPNFLAYVTKLEISLIDLDSSVNQFKEASDVIKDSKFADSLNKFMKLALKVDELTQEVKRSNQYSGKILNANHTNIQSLLDSFKQSQDQLKENLNHMSVSLETSLEKNHSLTLSGLENFDKKFDVLVDVLTEKTNSINNMTVDALRKIYQYHQAIFDSLQEIQAIQSQGNDEIKLSNVQVDNVVKELKSNSENIISTINILKEVVNSFELSSQGQSEKLLATMSSKIQTHQDQLQDSLKIIADDN